GFTRLPEASEQERTDLAARFAFTTLPLPEIEGPPPRSVRAVHPSLAHLASWISSVGASVALNDLDRDGLPNDLCYVDVRTDQVIVAPVPGTATRYAPFELTPAPVPYDAATMAPMGCLPGDLNEDGWMDLLVYYWGRTPLAFLRQDASSILARTTYVAQELVPGGARWFTNAAIRADFDGDGHIDVLIGNYFEDGARILDSHDTSVRQHMHRSMSRAFNGGTSRILRWTGASTGANPSVQYEVTPLAEENIAKGWTLAAGAADLDGDGLPEIYLGHDFGPDRLLHNRSRPGQLRFVSLTGRKTVTTPASKVLGHDSFKGMGVDFGDLNGDGLFDIYVSNIAAEYALEESHSVYVSTGQIGHMQAGWAPYTDRSEPLGLSRSDWGWESRLADFDNDGVLEAVQATGFIKGTIGRWPELHEVATGNDELLASSRVWHRFLPGDDLSGHAHNPFFVRSSSGRYVDIAPELGLDTPQVSRGIATADVDGDGDLDFAVANQWESSYFYRNDSPVPGAFLGLHLLLPLDASASPGMIVEAGHPDEQMAVRPALGAVATVHLPDGRRLVAQVDGGNGHSGARSPDVHLGLGAIPPHQKLNVDVRWRDAQGQVRSEMLTVSPGWHTVVLGKTNGE
ncbi:MAG TPA: CRTAC1 family protein, partial [Rhodothermales bacterium]|nr:CRTAC1 family protein [Rhodothermales bacterium]